MTSPIVSQLAAPLIESLLASFYHYQFQMTGRRIWLACSGGRDSLSLALICHQLYREGCLPFLPQLLHVDHGLQSANKIWATNLQSWAHDHQMPCRILRVQITGDNEQAAREARYDAMMQVMNTQDVLMLGHHLQDQAETVLMRLFTGSGINGLGGIRPWSKRQHGRSSIDKSNGNSSRFDEQTITLWRPWLQVSRSHITAYANAVDLAYVDDPTNTIDSDQPTTNQDLIANANDRAWLRSVIIPQIQVRFPHVYSGIARSGELLQAASETIEEQSCQDLRRCYDKSLAGESQLDIDPQLSKWQSVLDIDALMTLPSARRSATIHRWLSPSLTDLPASKRLVESVLELCQRCDHDHQTCLHWHSGQHHYEIRRYHHQLFRLRSEWVNWLERPPHSQKVSFNGSTPPRFTLKDELGIACWQLCQLKPLLTLLKKTLASIEKTSTFDQVFFQIAPLPRERSLTLAHRKGSKSGKKLLQALHIPAIMRSSVVLGELYWESISESVLADSIPLFILSTTGVTVLESRYSQVVESWLANHRPVMQLRHYH